MCVSHSGATEDSREHQAGNGHVSAVRVRGNNFPLPHHRPAFGHRALRPLPAAVHRPRPWLLGGSTGSRSGRSSGASDAWLMPRPRARPLQPRARRRPPRRRQAGLSARLLSLTGPARAAGAHGPPRELGPPGLQVSARPRQAAQVDEPRSSGPAPAARSSSRRCPLGTDQQQDGGQPRGRGPGVIVTRTAKNPPQVRMSPINSLFVRRLEECFSLTGQSACPSEPASQGACRTPQDVTVTARAGACALFPELLAAELLLATLEALPPLAFLRVQPFCGADNVFPHTRTIRERLLCAICFFGHPPWKRGLVV